MRLRANKDKLKIEHSIIDGLRPILERLVESPDIRAVIPGVIRPVRDAKGAVRIRVTVPVQNGWKAIALAAGARQELFISTPLARAGLETLLEQTFRAAKGTKGGHEGDSLIRRVGVFSKGTERSDGFAESGISATGYASGWPKPLAGAKGTASASSGRGRGAAGARRGQPDTASSRIFQGDGAL